MKKLVLLLASCILAGTVHAVDVTKAEAATKIESFPVTITTPGYYYLSPRIPLNDPVSTGPAITITASNVFLDLNGLSIVAANGIVIGVPNAPTSYVTVQNGSIVFPNFNSPIHLTLIRLNRTFFCTIDAVNINATGVTVVDGINDEGFGDAIKNCNIKTTGNCLVLFEQTIVSENFIDGPISSGGANVFRNNTFTGPFITDFTRDDEYIGNAFISHATHTGGIDIAGQ
jgi:hypothetical protein